MIPKDVLIVGAGPTGLTAALHLIDKGIEVRIIEKLVKPSPHSKAFGVNPRTLTLLESTGVTKRMLEQGFKMQAINAWKSGKKLFRIDLSSVSHKYPFMLVHSQAKSEALMREALEERAVPIEREVELTALKIHADGASVTLSNSKDDKERLRPSVILGADGASSRVRKSLDVSFSGSKFDEPWKLYDLELDTPLNKNEAHIFLLEGGGMFIVRLDDRLWRVISNVPDLLDHLPKDTTYGAITWESDFGISSLLVDQFQKGNAYLAGDAAHIHSGLGARGMNLGVEDAYVFAHLAATGQLDKYHRLRHPVDRAVVHQTERLTEIPRGRKPFAKVARTLIPFIAPIIPLGQKGIAKWVLGLDHEVKLS